MTARPFPETSSNPADGQDASKRIAPVTGSGSEIGMVVSNGLVQDVSRVGMASRGPETLNLWRRALVRRLRVRRILHDEDDSGQFFQLYSRPYGDGFFFKIVERRQGNGGYGAANAPFRAAAMKRLVSREPRTSALFHKLTQLFIAACHPILVDWTSFFCLDCVHDPG